jgi:hypothetical protein
VLLAVELVDPVTGNLVRDDVGVTVAGLTRPPTVNLTGRFVFLEEPGGSAPGEIKVEPRGAPFEAETADPPGLDDRRLRRILLRPMPAYPFPASATLIRGTLVEGPEPDAVPVPGAGVSATWLDQPAGTPAPKASTNAGGDFVLFVRLARGDAVPGERASGRLTLRFERDGAARTTDTLAIRERDEAATPDGGAAPVWKFDWDTLTPA